MLFGVGDYLLNRNLGCHLLATLLDPIAAR